VEGHLIELIKNIALIVGLVKQKREENIIGLEKRNKL